MSQTPVRTSVRGPIILTAVGAVLLVVAVTVAVLVVRLFLSIVPLGIVDSQGGPGPDAVGSTEVPGSITLTLSAETSYGVFLAHPASAVGVELSGPVTVTGPDGQPATASHGPSSTISSRSVTAHDIYTFRTGAAGEYTIGAPDLADADAVSWATVVVAEQDDLPGFFTGLFGTIFGVFLALGLGAAAVSVIIGGVIWWYLRTKARRTLGPQGPAAGLPYEPRSEYAPGHLFGYVPGQPADYDPGQLPGPAAPRPEPDQSPGAPPQPWT